LPVLNFLEARGIKHQTAVTCSSTSTFKEVIVKLADTGVHRLWVVSDGKPIRVISLSDIIRALMKVATLS